MPVIQSKNSTATKVLLLPNDPPWINKLENCSHDNSNRTTAKIGTETLTKEQRQQLCIQTVQM